MDAGESFVETSAVLRYDSANSRQDAKQEFTAMSISVRKQGDTIIIDLDGRLALGGPVDEFRATWSRELAAGNKNLILNLSSVTMVDSSGIGTMIRCHSAVSAAGGKLKVIGANGTVRKAFAITRLDKIFEFHDSEASALA